VEADHTGVLAHQRGGRQAVAMRMTKRGTQLRWTDLLKMTRWMRRLIMQSEEQRRGVWCTICYDNSRIMAFIGLACMAHDLLLPRLAHGGAVWCMVQ
jgi:predicted ATPase